ncbi:MAG: hypothetical protein ACP5JH_12000 [Bacteroidota bacterium]
MKHKIYKQTKSLPLLGTPLVTPEDSGLNLIEPIILVPTKLSWIMNAIQDEVGQDEFTILSKGQWNEEGFLLSEEYYIPQQRVTPSSCDYDEDLGFLREVEGWNVFIHKHPSGVTSFSFADQTSLHHFPCSLLWCDRKWVQGFLSTPVPTGVLGIPANVKELIPFISVPKLDAIKKTQIVAYPSPTPPWWERREEEWI